MHTHTHPHTYTKVSHELNFIIKIRSINNSSYVSSAEKRHPQISSTQPKGITCVMIFVLGLPCEHITAPLHGQMNCSDSVTNSTCFVSCSPGYSLSGSKTRICLPSSRWSGVRSSCEGKTKLLIQ